VSGGEVFVEVLNGGRAGDGQRVLAAVQLASEDDLLRVASYFSAIGSITAEGLTVGTSGDGARMPWRQDDPGVVGDLPHGGVEADCDVVVHGHGGDVGDRLSRAELLGADVGEAETDLYST
jgi:hypothetical protein